MEGVYQSFGQAGVLHDVNFQIGYNEVVGLLGDNGAGKSTLIKILTGVHTPEKGSLYWKGKYISSSLCSRIFSFERENVGIPNCFFSEWKSPYCVN